MNVADDKQAAILDDLKVKIRTVIERVGVTDMAVEIVIDLVARGLGRMGGRPPDPNRLPTGSKRVRNPPGGGISGSSSDLDLFSDPGSDLSEQSEEDSKDMSATPRAVVVKGKRPFQHALTAFCEAWRGRYGVRYAPSAAEINQLGKALATVPADTDFRRVFTRYLEDASPFVAQDMRHSLMHFATRGGFNKYRTTTAVMSAREAAGLEAGRQFVNGEGEHAGKR